MKIGFIGVGNMGNHMARHLLEAKHQVTVHDIRRDAAANLLEMGARWANSPAEASRGADIVFTSLPMPRDVHAVAVGKDGVIEGISRGSVYADLSTNSVSVVKDLYRVFKEKGMDFLDTPVSGGVRGAETKDMSVMVGGDETVYNRIKPVLDTLGDKVMYCGPVGSGTICKLTHQLFGACLGQVITEVLTLGVKAGVPLKTLVEAISKSAAGKRPPLEAWRTGQVEKNFEADKYTFYLELARKDIRLALEMGREFNVPLDLGNIVEQRLIEAMNRGWARKKSGIVRLLQEERAGVKLTS